MLVFLKLNNKKKTFMKNEFERKFKNEFEFALT